ncbi:MAG TPA: hypothetical protein PKH07_12760, partial [bacterium]|nr:hypothetical protein [bacterium]
MKIRANKPRSSSPSLGRDSRKVPFALCQTLPMISRLSILSLFLLIPLFVTTLGTDRYLLPKTALLLWTSSFLAACLFCHAVICGSAAFQLRLRLPILLYLLLISMSLSRSITLGSSLDVLLQWFSFFIVYQSVCIFFRQRAARLSLLLVQLGAGLSSLALLVTGLGLLPVKAPMASTFGNRNFLSEYLVLSLPVGIAVLSTAKSRSEKIFLLLSVLTQFLALVMASSQGAWLGCFASGIFLLLLQRGRVKHILGSLLGNQGLDEAVSFAGKPRVGADSAHTTADLGLLEKRPLRTKIVPRSV